MSDRIERFSRIADATGRDIIESLGGLLNQQQVNAFALEAVIVVESLGVNQRDVVSPFFVMIFSAPPLTASANSESLARACESGTISLAEKLMGILQAQEVQNFVHYSALVPHK